MSDTFKTEIVYPDGTPWKPGDPIGTPEAEAVLLRMMLDGLREKYQMPTESAKE
jgi:hypothetical protein